MQKKTFLILRFAALASCVVVHFPANQNVYSQGRLAVTPEIIARESVFRTNSSPSRSSNES